MLCVIMMCSDAAHGMKVLSHAAIQALVRKGSRDMQLARDTVVMAVMSEKQGAMSVV